MKHLQSAEDIIVRQPAEYWQDALPTGNGSIGALVCGNISNEIIMLNHEDLWFRSEKPQPPDISSIIPKVRQLLHQGLYSEANALLRKELKDRGYPRGHIDPYHPAFDVVAQHDKNGPFSSYRRSLAFETGEVRVAWQEAGGTFDRAVFVSRSDEVVVMRIQSSGSGAVTSHLSLKPHPLEAKKSRNQRIGLFKEGVPINFDVRVQGDWLTLIGRYERGGEYGGLARVTARGGKTEGTEKGISVIEADEILLLLKLFANESSETALPRLRDEIESLPLDYQALLQRHEAIHGSLFRRVTFDFRTRDDRATDEMMLQAYEGNVSDALIERMVRYGRYLLISSSRPGGLPANFSGIWNGDYDPFAQSDFHHDIDIEMNYWQSLPGNLAETALPYFDYYESLLDDWRENARSIYGCRGVLANICGSTHGVVDAVGPWEVGWTAGAGWIAQLFYDYWLFTGDREFLRQRAIPFMREAARFYEDFLVEGEDGSYIFSPSFSPENWPEGYEVTEVVVVNATMDVAVAREILTHLSEAYHELGMESEELSRWQAMLDKMPDYRVNKEGALCEWLHPDLRDRYSHRHLSHLYPIYPGLEITEENSPSLFRAGWTALEKRLRTGFRYQVGFSFTQMACTFARLGDGNRALECLELLLRSHVGCNLLADSENRRARGKGTSVGHDRDTASFIIECNLGFAAAVQEMVLSSRPGFVSLLPALPDRWEKGSIAGLRCRGNITVSIEWSREKVHAELISSQSQNINLKCHVDIAEINDAGTGTSIEDSPYGPRYRKIYLPAGEMLRIHIRLKRS
jgi:alpha-L-fucosidase 2